MLRNTPRRFTPLLAAWRFCQLNVDEEADGIRWFLNVTELRGRDELESRAFLAAVAGGRCTPPCTDTLQEPPTPTACHWTQECGWSVTCPSESPTWRQALGVTDCVSGVCLQGIFFLSFFFLSINHSVWLECFIFLRSKTKTMIVMIYCDEVMMKWWSNLLSSTTLQQMKVISTIKLVL